MKNIINPNIFKEQSETKQNPPHDVTRAKFFSDSTIDEKSSKITLVKQGNLLSSNMQGAVAIRRIRHSREGGNPVKSIAYND